MLDLAVVDQLAARSRWRCRSAPRSRCRRCRRSAGLDLGVDADDPARGVEQRPAGVAGIDRRVRLDHVVDREPVWGVDLALHRGDDPGRGGAIEAERVADRDDGVADLDARRMSPRDSGWSWSEPESTESTATSVEASLPTTFASKLWPSSPPTRTVTVAGPSTTCALVRMCPSLSMTKPEPVAVPPPDPPNGLNGVGLRLLLRAVMKTTPGESCVVDLVDRQRLAARIRGERGR